MSREQMLLDRAIGRAKELEALAEHLPRKVVMGRALEILEAVTGVDLLPACTRKPDAPEGGEGQPQAYVLVPEPEKARTTPEPDDEGREHVGGEHPTESVPEHGNGGVGLYELEAKTGRGGNLLLGKPVKIHTPDPRLLREASRLAEPAAEKRLDRALGRALHDPVKVETRWCPECEKEWPLSDFQPYGRGYRKQCNRHEGSGERDRADVKHLDPEAPQEQKRLCRKRRMCLGYRNEEGLGVTPNLAAEGAAHGLCSACARSAGVA